MPALTDISIDIDAGYYPSCSILPPANLQNTIRAGRNVWVRPMGRLEVAKGIAQTSSQNVGGRIFSLNDERASIAGAMQGERLPYAGLLRYQNAVIFFLSELTGQQVYINEAAAAGVTTSTISGMLRIAVPDGVGGYNTYDPGFDPPILPGGNVTTPAGGTKAMNGVTGVALAAWRSKTNANSAPSNIVYMPLSAGVADIFKVALTTPVSGQDGFLLLGTRWGDQTGAMRVVRFIYTQPRGTFSVTNGSPTIVGDADTRWLQDLNVGDVWTISGVPYTILTVTANNAATLAAPYAAATGAGKVGILTTVAADWYNEELGELIDFDVFKPPRAAGVLSFAGRVYLWGTDGKPGSMTGPGIRPLLDANPEHVGLTTILTELGDDLLNVLAGDTRLFLMTRNTLESVTFTGQSDRPYVIRILHQPGFSAPTAGCVFKNQFYGYDERPFRTVTDADIDIEFGAAVRSDMTGWDARRVVIAPDPKNNAVLYCQRNGSDSTLIIPWMGDLGIWGPPHAIAGQVVDWTVSNGTLYLIVLASSNYRVNGWEAGTGASGAYATAQPNAAGAAGLRKIVKRFLWTGKATTLTVYTLTPNSNYLTIFSSGQAFTLSGTPETDKQVWTHIAEALAIAVRIDFPTDGEWHKLIARGYGLSAPN